jgi:hypothetical protein
LSVLNVSFLQLKVQGLYGFTGNFRITSPVPTPSPTSSPTVTASPTYTPPGNDLCEGASTELELDSDVAVEGSTIGATVDDVEPCYMDQPEPIAGVWYIVTGTGNEAAIGLCEVGGNYDGFFISIFEGSCGSISSAMCLPFYDNCESGFGHFSWPTSAGVKYYLLVSWLCAIPCNIFYDTSSHV